MYLLVFGDRTCRQVSENLTMMDYMAAAQGISQIFRFREDKFERLIFDKEKPFWVPVRQSGVLACEGHVLNY